MSRIFVTGDIHGSQSIQKLSSRNWIEGRYLTKDDYLIILGDYGLIWHNNYTKEEEYWTNWLNDKPWTTLVCMGNHENWPRVQALPIIPMFGSHVGVIATHIFHLIRSNIYDIINKKFFVMGGATSTDKLHRIEGISWWPEEIPSYVEFDKGLDNLNNCNNTIDYIIAHTAPQSVCDVYIEYLQIFKYGGPDCMEQYLQTVIENNSFKDFYFGHWHDEWDYGKYHMRYDTITEIILED